jgi:hypothetical protein
MKFTVVFSTKNESEDLSFGLVFIPSPVWIQGRREIINLNPENPHYQMGSVRELLIHIPAISDRANNRCSVVTHQVGNGSEADLNMLLEDLKAEGFSVELIR